MSGQVETVSAPVTGTALENEGTAPPIQNPELPEGGEPEGDGAQPPAKVFTQEELDAIVGKRLARERRAWEREAREAQPPTPAPQPDPGLSPDQFPTPEAYAEALAERKAARMLAEKEAAQVYTQIIAAHEDREEQARERYDDYDAVIQNPSLHITPLMADVIRASDVGPEVAYYLGTNPKESERIARLSPILQAKEIGKLEIKVSSQPPVKKTSSAPAPISPVRSGGKPPVVDTTDPRSTETLSTSEWIAAERRRQMEMARARQQR